ncbi:MAG: 16S rRNA (cytosine(1402)-N(4))-methyltransferase RsmH [Pseudomonadota bacterium]
MVETPHIPVLLEPVLSALAPLDGAAVIDATYGAGGYSRAILAAGAARVVGIDRDPRALALGAEAAAAEPRLSVVEATFDAIEEVARDTDIRPDAIVFDIGVSSMQLDEAARGFSFMREGPLDMRMAQTGQSAADIVNAAEADEIADILHGFGEERAARRIARAIVAARAETPIETTLALAEIVSGCLPRPKPGQPHPATRTFQALRIAVNDELGQFVRALAAAERVLGPGGRLAVVTFHSLEDRIAKRFLQFGSGRGTGVSRHAPEIAAPAPRWEKPARAVEADAAETARNPRARSARMRAAVRTEAPALTPDPVALGLPVVPLGRGGGRGAGADRRRKRDAR